MKKKNNKIKKLEKRINQLTKSFMFAYIVLDAKFVSSCFNCPSKARPRLFLLFNKFGLTLNTFDNVKPGPTGLSLFKMAHRVFKESHYLPFK